MKLYRKRRPTLKQRLFKLIVILLIAGIIADIYFPTQFGAFKKYAGETYSSTKDKVIKTIIEKKEKRDREREIEKDLEKEKNDKEALKNGIIKEEESTSVTEADNKNYEATYEGIIYKTHGEDNLKLNIYRPINNEEVPLIVYIPGKEWHLNFNEQTVILDQLKKQSNENIAIAVLEYRDVDRAEFPSQLEDIKDAIKFINENSTIYGIDTHRIGVVGNNTGGTLAQILGITRNENDVTKNIRMVISQGAPTDIITLSHDVDGVHITKNDGVRRFGAANTPYGKIVGFNTERWMGMDGVRKMMAKESELKSNSYWKHVELAKTVSSYNLANENSAPLFIIHNVNDKKIPVKQSVKLVEKLNSLGVENQFISNISPTGGYDDIATIESSLQWGLNKLNVK